LRKFVLAKEAVASLLIFQNHCPKLSDNCLLTFGVTMNGADCCGTINSKARSKQGCHYF